MIKYLEVDECRQASHPSAHVWMLQGWLDDSQSPRP
jgi:hypothetical protein